MSDRPIDAEGATGVKNSKLTSDVGQNQAAIELTVVEAEDPPPQIFKLNIDCYEAVADWLSLKELHAFGETCTRHRQAAGYIFKEVYPAARVHCMKDGIYFGSLQVNGFCDYIQHLIINTDNLDCFRFIGSHSFALLKRIHLFHIELTDEKIACIKKVLKKVEIVELVGCELHGEFHDKFLQFCDCMKRLTVWPPGHNMEYSVIVIGANHDWLLRQYPKLEHFELSGIGGSYRQQRQELKMFFQRNPNIRHLATNVAQLAHAAEVGIRTKFEVFAINYFDDTELSSTGTILEYQSKLDEAERFFKRLHIYSYGIMTQSRLERFNLSNQIEKLYMNGDFTGSLSLNNLKEICVQCLEHHDSDLETAIVNGNPNLERVSLYNARLMDILAFIRGSSKLIKLRIGSFHNTVQENERILDLLELNNQRATLNRARKVAIYVEEEVFLATKWAKHTTDYKLIGLQRHQSNVWDNDL